jgi:hypothetical protein
MSNSKKKEQPHWLRHPKTQQEKKEAGSAKDQDVPVRGKRSKQNLPDLYDDKPVGSNLKKQNKSKKPSRDTIRKGEEDEQSVAKQMRKTGKATIKGPEVKERKRFAPATKVEKPKKGKGSYNRKNAEEDEEGLGTVPLRRDPAPAKKKLKFGKRKVDFPKEEYTDNGPGTVPNRRVRSDQEMKDMKKPLGGKRRYSENTNIVKFIDSILSKNYAAADKYIKQTVECKLQSKIEQELSTPLF